MKKHSFSLLFGMVMVICLLASCISLQDRIMVGQDFSELEVLGSVEVRFQSFQPLHIHISPRIKSAAYKRLLKQAKKDYAGKVDTNLIDIKNIKMEGKFSALQFEPVTSGGWYLNDWQTVFATGDVVINRSNMRDATRATFTGLEGAINRSNETLIQKLPEKSTIAVLNIYSENQETSGYIIDELEFRLVNSGHYKMVDRRKLDQIRQEQNFQISGDVSDESAVSIGNMLGATIVITGDISKRSSSNRLVIKALDVQSGQIITMTREEY
ncbi:MAG: penicillin-binding protein activator LpoB [Treponema sp.]|jgi:hypothetical protein|nr:penicillin-binding protein activator LpoB [Treponema sp.]